MAADSGARTRHCGPVMMRSKLPAQVVSTMKIALRLNHLLKIALRLNHLSFGFQRLHKFCTVDQCANIHIIAQIAAE